MRFIISPPSLAPSIVHIHMPQLGVFALGKIGSFLALKLKCLAKHFPLLLCISRSRTDTPCADIDMVERVARLPSGQREVPQGKGKEERARPTRSWLPSDWKEVTDSTGRDRSTCKCGGNITDRREVEECFGSDLLGSDDNCCALMSLMTN